MIQMPVSEIADRFSICMLKEDNTDEDMTKELFYYKKELDQYDVEIYKYVERLYAVNGEIWDLEASLRSGQEKKLGLEEVGRRAIQIRNKNRVRVSIKNEIVEAYGEGFKDIKVNHVSE